jgi:hypothetical protein
MKKPIVLSLLISLWSLTRSFIWPVSTFTLTAVHLLPAAAPSSCKVCR